MTSQPCYDHLGNQFSSEKQMLKVYNINSVAFHYRLEKLNMSLEEALTSPKRDRLSTAIECTDHLGNTFESKVAMCDYWHIPRPVYFRRIRDGWTLEKTLTQPIAHTNGIAKTIFDPHGQKFKTIDDMCAAWGKTKKQYMINIRNNCTLYEALTMDTIQSDVRDHIGNVYPSINAMCREYNITKTTLRSRIELGWTLEQVLTNPHKKSPCIKVTDHLGKTYSTQKEMLAIYGVSEMTYKHRLSIGWPLEKCLQSENQHNTKCTDHKGNQFNTISEMCAYWNIRESTYYGRRNKLHWSLEKTLTILTKSRYTKFGDNLIILKHVKKDYYEVTLNNENVILSIDNIIQEYHKNKEINYGNTYENGQAV